MSELQNSYIKSKKNIKSSINNFIENKITNNDIDEDIELEELEKELEQKIKYKNMAKNYGNLWNDIDRNIIIDYLSKNVNQDNNCLLDEKTILTIADKLERSEHGIKEEIKRMIFNEYIKGNNYKKLSKKFNIKESNIKILLKKYIEINGKKILCSIDIENKILQAYIDNIKLKKELEKISKDE